jgi:hypothetical protein
MLQLIFNSECHWKWPSTRQENSTTWKLSLERKASYCCWLWLEKQKSEEPINSVFCPSVAVLKTLWWWCCTNMSSGKASSQRRKRGVFVPKGINFHTVRTVSEPLFQKEAHEQLLLH